MQLKLRGQAPEKYMRFWNIAVVLKIPQILMKISKDSILDHIYFFNIPTKFYFTLQSPSPHPAPPKFSYIGHIIQTQEAGSSHDLQLQFVD